MSEICFDGQETVFESFEPAGLDFSEFSLAGVADLDDAGTLPPKPRLTVARTVSLPITA